MFSVVRRLAPAAILSVLVIPVGCNEKLWEVQKAPLVQKPLDRDALDRFYTPMYINAAAHNMNIADGHFYPHSSELNSLGITQLDRIAVVLEQRGGTVGYETRNRDDEFVSARISNIKTYLTDTGLDMSTVEVEGMMPGGRGLSGVHAQGARGKSDKAAEVGSARVQRAAARTGGK